MENLNAFVLRLVVAALTSAVFCAGAVYFVVDQSLRGVETAIILLGERVGDLKTDVNRFEDLSLTSLRALETKAQERDAELKFLSIAAADLGKLQSEMLQVTAAYEDLRAKFQRLDDLAASNAVDLELERQRDFLSLVAVLKERSDTEELRRELEVIEVASRRICEQLAEARDGSVEFCAPSGILP